MAAGKWIGGIIGWMAGGPLGALAGYLLGSLFESGLDSVNNPDNAGTFGYGSGRSSFQDYQQAYRQAYQQRQAQKEAVMNEGKRVLERLEDAHTMIPIPQEDGTDKEN